jgi:hypothetical protein
MLVLSMQSATAGMLSDADLIAEVKRLAQGARATNAVLVTHLAEIERRQLHLAAGFPSLFAYCTAVLRLSEYEAYSRIEAARAARSFPRVREMLGDGSLTLTTAQMLARNLTRENAGDLLVAAAGKGKAEVQELLARYSPMPDAPPTVRKLPAPRTPSFEPVPQAMVSQPSQPAEPQQVVPPPSRYRPPVTPLAPERYQITFTASASTREKLRCAQDLLRHAVPSGDTAEVIDRALTVLLEDLERKKLAATDRPRTSPTPAGASRHVPAGVKRAVWVRDGGRCAFISRGGQRCGERGFIEFHHVEPYARGGATTIGNVQLRCRAHNAYEADLEFGPRRPGGEWAVHESRQSYGDGHSTRSGTSRPP